MKSAYDLAMERLEREDPSSRKPVGAEQKEELAAIDAKFNARQAERRIFLEQRLAEAGQAGDQGEAERLRREISDERERIDAEREAAKERVRNRRDD